MNPFKQWRDQLGAGRAGRSPIPRPDPSGLGRPAEWALLRAAREWTRIHTRRWAHLLHGAAAENRAVGR